MRRYVPFMLFSLAIGCGEDPATPAGPETPAASVGATAAHYTFLTIADNRRDNFSRGSFGCPAINQVGQVAFHGERENGTDGIYRGVGTGITVIAENGARFSFIGISPSINDLGAVSFAANLKTGGSGIFRGRGGAITTITESNSGPFEFFGFDTSVNDAGNVAFKAEQDDFDEGMFFGSGGAITTVYLASTSQFAGSDVGPAINDLGQIAFLETLDNFDQGLFLWNGSTFIPVAVAGGTSEIGSFFRAPSLNDRGVVGFHAFLVSGAEAVFKGSGGQLTLVADTDGPISSFDFGGPSINNAGVVAFAATLDTGEQGIFTGPDVVNNRVIGTGDNLKGSQVSSLVFCREGLNREGQLAFAVQLVDGRSLVIRATPIP